MWDRILASASAAAARQWTLVLLALSSCATGSKRQGRKHTSRRLEHPRARFQPPDSPPKHNRDAITAP